MKVEQTFYIRLVETNAVNGRIRHERGHTDILHRPDTTMETNCNRESGPHVVSHHSHTAF